MLDQIKPGNVLRFGTCPSTIHSPAAGTSSDNTKIDQFPLINNNLGNVTCFSRVSGNLEEICDKAATKLRGGC